MEGYLPYRGRSLKSRDDKTEKSAEAIVPMETSRKWIDTIPSEVLQRGKG